MTRFSNDQLADLAVFALVASSASLTAAARELGLSVSAVSRSVARLERSLGAHLLLRNSRSVAPTPLGLLVQEQAQVIQQAAAEVQAIASSSRTRPAGLVRLTAPTSLGLTWLSDALAGFRSVHAEIAIDVTLSDSHADLLRDGFDVAVRVTNDPPPASVARRLFSFDFWLVATPGYLATHPPMASPPDLAHHVVLFLGQRSYGDQLAWTGPDGPGVLLLKRHVASNSSILLTKMALHGHGVALCPSFVVAPLVAAGQLRRVMPGHAWAGAYQTSSVHAITPQLRTVPAPVRLLIEHLRGAGQALDAAPA